MMVGQTDGERGSAMATGITLLAIIAFIGIVIGAMTMQGVFGSHDARARAGGHAAVESGIAAYRHALSSGVANEATGWTIPESQVRSVVQGAGITAQVLDAGALSTLPDGVKRFPARVDGTPMPRFTVRVQSGAGAWNYWQLVHVVPLANASDSNLVVWFRGWRSDDTGSVTMSPRLVRVEFVPGGFQSFELLSDAPMVLEDGARIDGPIHSNGAGGGPAISVAPGASVRCVGQTARVSAGSGGIGAGVPCPRVPGQAVWDLSLVSRTFDGIRRAAATNACNGCVLVVRTVGNGVVPVRLSPPDRITIGGQTRRADPSLAVVIEGDVDIQGTTSSRVTIAADRGSTDGRGARITVSGNLRATGSRGAIGLYTRGDVVVGTSPCVSRIDAGIVAERGALTIDPALLSQVRQDRVPTCGAIQIRGSVSGQRQPTLRWGWSDGSWTGYRTRTYSWNPELVRRPPPFAPRLDTWDVVAWREASQSCITNGGATWNTGSCR